MTICLCWSFHISYTADIQLLIVADRYTRMHPDNTSLYPTYIHLFSHILSYPFLHLNSEKMNGERLRDQLALMGGRHREELLALQQQHG